MNQTSLCSFLIRVLLHNDQSQCFLLNPLKRSENLWFSDVFTGIKRELVNNYLILQNGQTHFQNIAAFAARFLRYIWPFLELVHKRVKNIKKTFSIKLELQKWKGTSSVCREKIQFCHREVSLRNKWSEVSPNWLGNSDYWVLAWIKKCYKMVMGIWKIVKIVIRRKQVSRQASKHPIKQAISMETSK